MQIVSSAGVIPQRLTCSGCRHWERIAFQFSANAEPAGRCGRFAETRPADARPRCNICWEPAAVALTVPDRVLTDD